MGCWWSGRGDVAFADPELGVSDPEQVSTYKTAGGLLNPVDENWWGAADTSELGGTAGSFNLNVVFSDIPVGEKRYRDIPGAADDGGLVVDDELTAGHFPGGSCQPHFRPERVDETDQCAHQRPDHQQRYKP